MDTEQLCKRLVCISWILTGVAIANGLLIVSLLSINNSSYYLLKEERTDQRRIVRVLNRLLDAEKDEKKLVFVPADKKP